MAESNKIPESVSGSFSRIRPKGGDEVYILSTGDLCIERIFVGSHNIMHES